MRDYLIFILFTGLRRQEAATLTWKQVDFEEGCFTITDTKNKSPHTLPLSDYLHNLLKDRQDGLKTELAEAKAALAMIDTMTTIRQRQEAHNRVALAEKRLVSPYVFPGEGKTGYIILNVDRLREPMQRVTDSINERINKQSGEEAALQSEAK